MAEDLRHEPILTDSTLGGVPMPDHFAVQGPHEGELSDVYMCSLCRVLYEDDPGNVCAAKLARRLL